MCVKCTLGDRRKCAVCARAGLLCKSRLVSGLGGVMGAAQQFQFGSAAATFGHDIDAGRFTVVKLWSVLGRRLGTILHGETVLNGTRAWFLRRFLYICKFNYFDSAD